LKNNSGVHKILKQPTQPTQIKYSNPPKVPPPEGLGRLI
jgi:hypothetical protein